MQFFSTRLFSWRQIVLYASLFVGGFALVQRVLRFTCANWITFDCPDYWPISIFTPRVPDLTSAIVAITVIGLFFVAARWLEVRRYKLWLTVACGMLLIAGLTYIHGVQFGFYAPLSGDAQTGVLIPISPNGQEYYHDALTVTDPAYFLGDYNEIQPTLHRHAHTHPPGAVLTFYFLQRLIGDPALISILLMMLATGGTGFFVYRLFRTEFERDTSGYMVFLLVLLPAVEIYYLATIDAVIAALLLGVLYLFCFGRRVWSIVGAAAMLCAAFLLTFVSLFILPVLVGFDLVVRRTVRRSAVVIGSLAAFHLILYLGTGYDAWHSFRTASAFENGGGFMLLTDPWNYIFTRLEDLAELAFFFGPFLSVLFVRSLRDSRLRPLDVLTMVGCLTMLAMFISGAWRTGETARACIFIYPFLLFPIARYLERENAGPGERMQLASLVFLQSVGMQVFGNYFW